MHYIWKYSNFVFRIICAIFLMIPNIFDYAIKHINLLTVQNRIWNSYICSPLFRYADQFLLNSSLHLLSKQANTSSLNLPSSVPNSLSLSIHHRVTELSTMLTTLDMLIYGVTQPGYIGHKRVTCSSCENDITKNTVRKSIFQLCCKLFERLFCAQNFTISILISIEYQHIINVVEPLNLIYK